MRAIPTGIKTERKVQDTSFHMAQLRNKVNQIEAEVKALEAEQTRLATEASTFSQMSRKHETLLKAKWSLEGTLADYNLAMESVVGGRMPHVHERKVRIPPLPLT